MYGEDFIGDLSGLLSAAAGKAKTDDPAEFQVETLNLLLANYYSYIFLYQI